MPTIANRGIVVAALLAVTDAACALPADVVSTTDSNGLFTYTFQRGDTPYVWGLTTNDAIGLTAYGVLQVHTPPGWTHTMVDPHGIIFAPTRGTNFLDEPVSFSVRSCLTEPVPYQGFSGRYPGGTIVGVVYELPGRTNILGGGYQNFSYLGPALPHLAIEQSGPDILLRWPASALGLSVEGSDLKTPWTSVDGTPAISGSSWVLQVPAQPSPRFFRLVTPCSQ